MDNCIFRRLELNDYYKGFFELLNELTPVGEYNYELFVKYFNGIDNTYVIEKNNLIIATGKILIEQKLHNNFSKMGHIEDIVVKREYRKLGFGKYLIKKLVKIGNENNCYKIVLNCNDINKKFYLDCDFICKGIEMCIYL